MIERQESRHAPLIAIDQGRLAGLDFKLFDPRGLYPGEDRMSFVFLECPELPFLDGRLVEIASIEDCPRGENETLPAASCLSCLPDHPSPLLPRGLDRLPILLGEVLLHRRSLVASLRRDAGLRRLSRSVPRAPGRAGRRGRPRRRASTPSSALSLSTSSIGSTRSRPWQGASRANGVPTLAPPFSRQAASDSQARALAGRMSRRLRPSRRRRPGCRRAVECGCRRPHRRRSLHGLSTS